MAKTICICGPDRVGKHTQASLLLSHLKKMGNTVELIEVPIRGSTTYKIIYWMLESGWAKKLPMIFQFVHFLNRVIFQLIKLPALLRQNDFIIFDRWSLSLMAYGSAEGVPVFFTKFLCRFLHTPDMTIVLNGLSHAHDPEDVYEKDSALQSFVRQFYTLHAIENNLPLIESQQEKEKIQEQIMFHLASQGIITQQGKT